KHFGSDKNVHIYASGANPSGGKAADKNAKTVSDWISSVKKDKGWEADASFGKGDPSVYKNNLDCYGLHRYANGDIAVNNDRISLTMDQRDPSGGLQTLFCMYEDPDKIREQLSVFSKKDIENWVKKAKEKGLDKACDMTDKEILDHFSSTPDCEVPWFCQSIRQAAFYVKKYMNGEC
ncbi:MAG: hypothetical protein NC120_13365, partial [Ruminococcus sp.]|nr:hypothetical protein [Ruminococcus sp.]